MTVQLHFDADDSKALLSIDKINKGLAKLGFSAGVTEKDMNKLSSFNSRNSVKNVEAINRAIVSLDNNVKNTISSFKGLVAAATAFAGISFSFASFVKAGDSVTNLENRLALVTGRTDELDYVRDTLYDISLSAGTSVQNSIDMFNRLGMTLGDSYNTDSIIAAVESIQYAAKVSGGSAESLNAAMIQLSQGLASGELRGEELNSVLEQAPRIALAIADGLGIPFGELRELAKEGGLTTEKVLQALTSQTAKLKEEAALMGTTVSSGFQVFNDGLTLFIGKIDQTIGLTSWLGNGLKTLGTVFAEMSKGVGKDIETIKEYFSVAIDIVTIIGSLGSELIFQPIAASFKAMIDSIVSYTGTLLSSVKAPFEAFYNYVTNLFYELYMYVIGNSKYRETIDGVVEYTQALWSRVKSAYDTFKAGVMQVFNSVSISVVGIFAAISEQIVSSISNNKYAGLLSDFIENNLSKPIANFKLNRDLGATLKSSLESAFYVFKTNSPLGKSILNTYNAFSRSLDSVFGRTYRIARDVYKANRYLGKSILTSIKEAVLAPIRASSTLKSAAKVFSTVYTTVGNFLSRVKTKISSIFSISLNILKDPLGKAISLIKYLSAQLQKFLTAPFKYIGDAYVKGITYLNTKITQGANYLSNLFSTSLSDVILVGTLGAIALSFEGARAILFSALKRLIFISFLPLLNNTFVTGVIGLWSESIINHIIKSFDANSKRLSSTATKTITDSLFVSGAANESTISLFSRSIANALNAVGGAATGAVVTAITGSEAEGIKAGKNLGATIGQVLGVAVAAAFFSPVRAVISNLFSNIFFDELQGNARRLQTGLFSVFDSSMSAASVRILERNILYTFRVVSRLMGIGIGLAVSDNLTKYLGVDPNSLEGFGIKVASAIGGAIALGMAGPAMLSALAGSNNAFLMNLVRFLTGVGANNGTVGLVGARAILGLFARGFTAYTAVYSDIGRGIISNLAESFSAGASAYTDIIQAAIVTMFTIGPRLLSVLYQRVGGIGLGIVGLMAVTVADKALVKNMFDTVGLGEVYSEALVNAIAAGVTSKQAGFSNKVSAAIAAGVAGVTLVGDVLEENGSDVGTKLKTAMEHALLAGSVSGGNPYVVVGVGIASFIYQGLDDKWKAKINEWVAWAAQLMADAFKGETWTSIADSFAVGWNSLKDTITNVIDRIINAKNALLEFLGINKKSYTDPNKIANPQEYLVTRQIVQERINDTTARLQEIGVELQGLNSHTQEYRDLVAEQTVLTGELTKLKQDNQSLTFGPAGRFIGILAGQRENQAAALEKITSDSASRVRLDKLLLSNTLSFTEGDISSRVEAIQGLLDSLSEFDPANISAMETQLNKLASDRQFAVEQRDTLAKSGLAIPNPDGPLYLGMAAQWQAKVTELDSLITPLETKLETVRANSDQIEALKSQLSAAVDEVLLKSTEAIYQTRDLSTRISGNIALNTQSFLDQSNKWRQTTSELEASKQDLDVIAIAVQGFVNKLAIATGGLPDSSAFPQAARAGYATGGWVSGPGTGTSDSIPAMLSNGEFVVNAKATKKFLPLLQKLNNGKIGHFADGTPGPISGGVRVTSAPRVTAVDPTLSTVDNLYINRVDNALYKSTVDPLSPSSALGVSQAFTDAVKNGDMMAQLPYDAMLSGIGSTVAAVPLGIMKANGYIKNFGEATEAAGSAADKASDKAGKGAKKYTNKFESVLKQFEDLKSSLDPEVLGSLNEQQVQSALAISQRIDSLTKERNSMVAGSEAARAATEEIARLKDKFDSIGQGSAMMRETFQQNFTAFLKGEQSFSDMIHGVLDTLTSAIIDKFSQAFTKNLFKSLGLDQFFDNIFSSIFDSLAKSTGGGKGAIGSAIGSGIGNFIASLGGLGGNWLGGWATGGYISGPGTGTSDSILARLSNGEYVMNAATTKRWLPFLETINANDGRLPAFASGGLVGPSNPSAFTSTNGNNNDKNKQQVFNINVSGDVSMQTRKEIARMIPEITAGVNMTNRERGSR